MTRAIAWRSTLLTATTLVAITLVPLLPLMCVGLWPNHPDIDSATWQVARMGRFFAVHGAFPSSLESERFAGSTLPAFYAPLLFPLLSLVCNVVGAEWTLRLAVVAVWSLQGLLVFKLFRKIAARTSWGLGVTALVSWTIYPLNNLYHRGGVAECLATALLISALCAGCLALTERRRTVKVAFALLCVWCGALAAGSHSITAVLGGLTAGCLTLAAMPVGLRRRRGKLRAKLQSANQCFSQERRRRWAALTVLTGVLLLTAAPWLYVTFLYGHRVAVASKTSSLVHQPGHDSLSVRLMPFPLNDSPDYWPHNNTQLNTPLLILLAMSLLRLTKSWRSTQGIARRRFAALWREWGSVLRVGLVLLILSIALSTSSVLVQNLPKSFAFVQYAYRLINVSNIAMLAALLSACAITRPQVGVDQKGWVHRCVWIVVLGISAIGMGMKLSLAFHTLVPAKLAATWRQFPDSAAQAPPRFHAQKDYAITNEARLLAHEPVSAFQTVRSVVLPVGTGSQFGVTQRVELHQVQGSWVQTSVVSFPWNQMLLDSLPVPPEQVREVNQHLAVYVPKGTHTVGYQPQPDDFWQFLRLISVVSFVALSACTLVSFGITIKSR